MASLITNPGTVLSSEVGEHSTSAKPKYFHIKLLVMNSEWEFTSATEVMLGENVEFKPKICLIFPSLFSLHSWELYLSGSLFFPSLAIHQF